MNEIQQLKDRRDQLTNEMEGLQTALLPYEAALENPGSIEQGREREVRDQYNERKRKFDSLDLEIMGLNQKIYRRENLANHKSLIADYIEGMASRKADEQELNEKRESLSTRLEQIRQQAKEDMAKARLAETDAATAYAQAVAWGDIEGEKNANADALKAAKNLAIATDHKRRQHLIISALEQELLTVDQYIAEAQKEHKDLERKALRLSQMVLEEKWNKAAKALFDVGGKLWANYNLLGHDQIGLLKLVVPEEGEHLGKWTWEELADRANRFTVQDVLAI